MKKILTLALAMALGSSAFADDFSLYYDANEGTENNKIETVANLQKITFENGNMVITRKDGTTAQTSLTSVKRLFFSTEEAVGIEPAKEVKAKAGKVYDLAGRRLAIEPEKLTKGIYIIDGKKVAIEK